MSQIFRLPPRWLFIRVETEGGIIGWGESSLEGTLRVFCAGNATYAGTSCSGHTEAVEGASLALRETFLGWDGDKIQDIWQHAYRSRFYRGGPVLMVRAFPAFLDILLRCPSVCSLHFPDSTLLSGTSRARSSVYLSGSYWEERFASARRCMDGLVETLLRRW